MNMLRKYQTHFLDSGKGGLYLTIEYFENQEVISKEVRLNKEKRYVRKGKHTPLYQNSLFLV